MATVVVFAGATWFFAVMKDSSGSPAVSVPTAALLGLLFAFTYLGWKFLTNYFPQLWGGTGTLWLVYLILKFIAAYFIGLIVGPFQIIKMLNQLRILSRVKHQIATGEL
jgi:hypothetical protein